MVKKIYPEDLDEDNELPEEMLHDTPRKRKLRLKKESSVSANLRRESKIERRKGRQNKLGRRIENITKIWENS